MKIFYKTVTVVTSFVFLFLSYQLFFTASDFVGDLGLDPTETTTILARRVAMFMLGISVLMFFSRNLPHSRARQVICLATGVTLFGLSCTGMYELVKGTVNSSIWIAIIIETVLWISLGIIILKNLKQQS